MQTVVKFCTVLFLIVSLFSCQEKKNKETIPANYEVVPLPAEIKEKEGNPFLLSTSTKIVFPEGNKKMSRNAEFLSEYIELSTGTKLSTTSSTTETEAIILSLGLQSKTPEDYEININENQINIKGASEAGVFYGIQTLRKSIPTGNNPVALPPVFIKDSPRFSYRGMMLDVARHFQPVDFVKKFIDILALHNINTFHWHLTEDQGWRIEIKSYPRLTSIGFERRETVIGRNTGEYDGKPHRGFYTQEEIKDIVKYAEERYINVIPEIDMPGHMLAALASYPELGCTGGPYQVAREWGIFEDVLCPGKDSTFIFLENVLSEVAELFPSKYIHIGGDECPKTKWEECADCQARIKELGLRDRGGHTAEHYLQSYVTTRMEKFLNEKGKSIIGWDEILEGEIAPNATVMSWRGIEGGIKAAKLGHDVIMVPTSYSYFDYYQTDDIDKEPLAIGGYVPLEKVYSFEPIPDELIDEQKVHILGPQANLWTEYISTPEHVEYMIMPRMAALAETQWVQPEKKNYEKFLLRLPRLLYLYEKLRYNFATHVFDIKANMSPNFETNALDVELSTIDEASIYYTLDGSEPTEKSIKYEGKFSIKENTFLKAKSIRAASNNSKIFEEWINKSKSSYKPIDLRTKPDPEYKFSGADLLVDGLHGTGLNYRTGKWIGFKENDLVAVIDMLEPTAISKAEIRNCIITADHIFGPSEIIIESREKDTTYVLVNSQKYLDLKTENWSDTITHVLNFEPKTARYFRVTVRPQIIPTWHPGKGERAFVFVDEITLN